LFKKKKILIHRFIDYRVIIKHRNVTWKLIQRAKNKAIINRQLVHSFHGLAIYKYTPSPHQTKPW